MARAASTPRRTSSDPIPLKMGEMAEVGAPPVEPVPPLVGLVLEPVGVVPPPVKLEPVVPGVKVLPRSLGELIDPRADGELPVSLEELPLSSATKEGEAAELTVTVPRSSVMTCWLGRAMGREDVSLGGRRPATLLAALSSVSRLTLIWRPSRVRAAEAPDTVSVALVTAMVMPSSLRSELRAEMGSDSGADLPTA